MVVCLWLASTDCSVCMVHWCLFQCCVATIEYVTSVKIVHCDFNVATIVTQYKLPPWHCMHGSTQLSLMYSQTDMMSCVDSLIIAYYCGCSTRNCDSRLSEWLGALGGWHVGLRRLVACRQGILLTVHVLLCLSLSLLITASNARMCRFCLVRVSVYLSICPSGPKKCI